MDEQGNNEHEENHQDNNNTDKKWYWYDFTGSEMILDNISNVFHVLQPSIVTNNDLDAWMTWQFTGQCFQIPTNKIGCHLESLATLPHQ